MSRASVIPAPVLTKIEGFEVTDTASPALSPASSSSRTRLSLLSELLSSLEEPRCSQLCSERSYEETDAYSDDEDDAGSPGAVPIPIHQRDEEYYKRMLRARAIVNCKLWQQQDQVNVKV